MFDVVACICDWTVSGLIVGYNITHPLLTKWVWSARRASCRPQHQDPPLTRVGMRENLTRTTSCRPQHQDPPLTRVGMRENLTRTNASCRPQHQDPPLTRVVCAKI